MPADEAALRAGVGHRLEPTLKRLEQRAAVQQDPRLAAAHRALPFFVYDLRAHGLGVFQSPNGSERADDREARIVALDISDSEAILRVDCPEELLQLRATLTNPLPTLRRAPNAESPAPLDEVGGPHRRRMVS